MNDWTQLLLAVIAPTLPPADGDRWRVAHIGFERDGLQIGGHDVWHSPWQRTEIGSPQLPHPAHPQQMHTYTVYAMGTPERPMHFAACELSNGVWGFYVRADDPVDCKAITADGSLRWQQRISPPSDRPGDRPACWSVLTDVATGRVLLDCAAWAFSAISQQADSSLLLRLRQNHFDTLIRIDPPRRLFTNLGEPDGAHPLPDLAAYVKLLLRDGAHSEQAPNLRFIAPCGTIRVDLASVEWFNSHWVNTPRVIDMSSGSSVLDLWDTDWDAGVTFPAQRQVRLNLRRYRSGCCATVDLDLARNLYRISDPSNWARHPAAEQSPLANLAVALDAWCQATTESAERAAPAAATSPMKPAWAWRTVTLILIGASLAIAAGAYWSQHSVAAPKPVLNTVPAMSAPQG